MLLTESEELTAACPRGPFWDLLSVLESWTEHVSVAAPDASSLKVLTVDTGATENFGWGPSVKVMGRVVVKPAGLLIKSKGPEIDLEFVGPM